MDEGHFQPSKPQRTATALLIGAAGLGVLAVFVWLQVNDVVGVVLAVGVVVALVFAVLLRRVELIVRPSGIEVVDITGRRRQAWVGTQRLVIDFDRARPLLEIDAPGPGKAYRSTLVLAGLEQPAYAEQRQQLSDLIHQWAGGNVHIEFHEPQGRSSAANG